MSGSLQWAGAADAARAIATRELSPVELTRALLERIETAGSGSH
jgi:Asp-tRNA(Asn)/Glu-tRNA(Gln) amidotransferase A subunit family amidase